MADAQSATTDPAPPLGTDAPPPGLSTTPVGAAPDTTKPVAGEAGADSVGRETPAEEAKPSLLGEKPPEAPKVEFDFAKVEVPEGLKLDDAMKSSLGEIFSKPDLTPEARTSQLLKLYASETAKIQTSINETWTKTNNDWIAQAQSDKEIGGEALRSTVIPTVAKFIATYGDAEFRNALDLTGAGNHPAIIRTLYRAAKALTEGGHVAGKPPGTSAARAATIGAALYGPEGPKTSIRGE